MLLTLRRHLRPAGALALLSVLAACGGGGGGGTPRTNLAPVAIIVADGYTGEGAPFSLRFDGSRSADPDGSITSYSWSFGDGQTGAGASVIHEFTDSQSHTVTLTVTDNDGDTASTRTVIAGGADPLFARQWHLQNQGQSGGTAGEDLNVVPLWSACGEAADCRGEGVRIAVVDDGLELAHEDLAANIIAGGSYDYLTGDVDPSPADAGSAHGTAVAGIAAARDHNSLGGRGVAPRAGLVGYNLLQNATSTNQADAMSRNGEVVDISTNSWGAPDGTGTLQPSDLLWRDSIESGLSAQGGRGIVYVWAAGNGDGTRRNNDGRLLPVDNSNYDGQANFYGVMAVAALDDNGRKASYSEPGANLWISAPGGQSCSTADAIVTTDLSGSRGLNAGTGTDLEFANYTKCMNGTSSATPMVAGVAALVRQARPELGWRDVKLILARSARRNDPANPDWTQNGADYWVNHNYGFGAADAQAAVTLARSWTPLAPAVAPAPAYSASPGLTIPDDNEAGVASEITVAGSGIGRIEFVEVYFTSRDHPYPGDLEIVLTSPSGTRSRLAETHLGDCRVSTGEEECAYNDWRFGTARHLDEPADGVWRLTVADKNAKDQGSFQNWRLVFHGRAG